MPTRDLPLEVSEESDGAWRVRMRHQTIYYVFEKPDPQEPERNAARVRWLKANDVHTEFFDGGIGCCWLARIGDQEPVIGPTEDEAITRLARLNGLELMFEVWNQLTGESTPRSVRAVRDLYTGGS